MSSSPHTPAPIALGRVDDLLAKIFAVAALVLAIDVVTNAMAQLPLLYQPVFYLCFSALMVALLGSAVAAFWFGNMRFWYRAIVFTTLASILLWPLQLSDLNALPEDFKPWIWWELGFASLAATGAFKRKLAFIFLAIMPMAWFLLRISPFGGSSEIALAVEDSLYSFFFSTSVALMVMFLRHRAGEVDAEFSALSKARIRRAFLDAVQLEKTKVNAIVHDSVIASLDAASQAQTEGDRITASRSAAAAIARLESEKDRDPLTPERISSKTLIASLSAAIARRSTQVQVKTKSAIEHQVPYDIAVAIAEATFQALNNSIVHAPSASSRKVTLSTDRETLKVVILDNGPGFRMSSVPQSRLGVRLAIFGRLKTLGVEAHLQSSPGQGATWVFEWRAK